MRSVQPRAIAYIAVQVRSSVMTTVSLMLLTDTKVWFALSSSSSWELRDDNFNYKIFYNNIVDWFECPRSQAKGQEIEELLLWWDRWADIQTY